MNIQDVIRDLKNIKKEVRHNNPYKSEKFQAKKVINAMKEKRDTKKGRNKELYKIIISNLENEYKR